MTLIENPLQPLKRDGKPVTLLDVKADDCRWMYGNGAQAPLCARPALPGTPYCTAHNAIARAPTRRTSDHWGWR